MSWNLISKALNLAAAQRDTPLLINVTILGYIHWELF